MEIRGVRGDGGVYPKARAAENSGKIAQSWEPAVFKPQTDSVELSSGASYLKSLRQQFPQMYFSVGPGFAGRGPQNTGESADRWAFTIHPELLEKMSADPEAEAAYLQRFRDIQRATALADSFSRALGMKTVYCENFIDENGQLRHISVSVRRDQWNERLREEARARTEELIEHLRQGSREAADTLEELWSRAEEEGDLVLGDEEMRLFMDGAKNRQARDKEGDGEDGNESSQSGGCVGINAAKLARMLAAAKTRDQVRAVIAQIQSDLKECDAGRARGFDVDEASEEAAKALLQEAQARLGQAENREATPEEELSAALAALM